MKFCKHSHKKRYRSKQQSDEAKHYIQNCKGEVIHDIYSYYCHHCKGWHHGGMFRREMRERHEIQKLG